MKILAVDVSYCSLGYCLYDLSNSQLTSKTIKFSSASSINKKEQLLFKNYDIDNFLINYKQYKKELKEKVISKFGLKPDKSKKKQIKDYIKRNENKELEIQYDFYSNLWKNIRLYEFYKELKDLNFDTVIAEEQFSVISDVFAVIRLVAVNETEVKPFKSYYPKSWRKILFGKGDIGKSEEAKEITEDKVKLFLENIELKHNFNSQDEIDSFALIMTYLKENKLVNEKSFEGIEIK